MLCNINFFYICNIKLELNDTIFIRYIYIGVLPIQYVIMLLFFVTFEPLGLSLKRWGCP